MSLLLCQDPRKLLAPSLNLRWFGGQECGLGFAPSPSVCRFSGGLSGGFSLHAGSGRACPSVSLAPRAPHSVMGVTYLRPRSHRNWGDWSVCARGHFPEILCGFQEIPKGEPGPPKVTKPHAVVTSPELGRAGGSTQRKHVKGDHAWRSVTFPAQCSRS